MINTPNVPSQAVEPSVGSVTPFKTLNVIVVDLGQSFTLKIKSVLVVDPKTLDQFD